jgi:hypothetical protein
MPPKTPDQLKQKAEGLRKKLREKRASLDGARARALGKKIRRAQRRRRVLVARAARLAGAGKEKKEG